MNELLQVISTSEAQLRELKRIANPDQNLVKIIEALSSSFKVDVSEVLTTNTKLDGNRKQIICSICDAINSVALKYQIKTKREIALTLLEDMKYYSTNKVVYFDKFDKNRTLRPNEPIVKRNLTYSMVKDKNSDRYCMLQREEGLGVSSISGGIDGVEDPAIAGMREAIEESGYKNLTLIKKLGEEFHMTFYHPNKKLNYYSVCHAFIYETDANDLQELTEEEIQKHHTVRMTTDEIRQTPDLEPTILYLLDMIEEKPTNATYIDRYNQYNIHPDSTYISHD